MSDEQRPAQGAAVGLTPFPEVEPADGHLADTDLADTDLAGTDPAGTDPAETGEVRTRRARRRPALTTVAAGLLVLALSGLVAVLGLDVARSAAESDRREAALAGARQMAVNFTSLAPESIDEDISDIVRLATGTFQQEYSTQSETIRTLVAEQQLTSEGTIITAGLQSFDGDTAVAVLAVDSVVTTAERPEGDTVRYRLQIDLTRVDGRWLSEKVQFVL